MKHPSDTKVMKRGGKTVPDIERELIEEILAAAGLEPLHAER